MVVIRYFSKTFIFIFACFFPFLAFSEPPRNILKEYQLKFTGGHAYQRNILLIEKLEKDDSMEGKIIIDWSPGPISREPFAHETVYSLPFTAVYLSKTGCFSFQVKVNPIVKPPVVEMDPVEYTFDLCAINKDDKITIFGTGTRKQGDDDPKNALFGIFGEPLSKGPQ